jgi:cytochrome c oxidase subunit II
VFIAFKSFPLLYFTDVTPEPDMTIKAIGHQWYWQYEYPDNGNFTFDAYMIPDNEIKPGQYRLLEADNHVVVPIDTTIKVLIAAEDVIHAWAMPAFGVKEDAVPGRLNESWFKATKEGVYYGQCSELCGNGHAYMPIVVEVVSKDKFQEWVKEAQTKFAKVDGTPPSADVAQNVPSN